MRLVARSEMYECSPLLEHEWISSPPFIYTKLKFIFRQRYTCYIYISIHSTNTKGIMKQHAPSTNSTYMYANGSPSADA